MLVLGAKLNSRLLIMFFALLQSDAPRSASAVWLIATLYVYNFINQEIQWQVLRDGGDT